jgi:hypothetical protein
MDYKILLFESQILLVEVILIVCISSEVVVIKHHLDSVVNISMEWGMDIT